MRLLAVSLATASLIGGALPFPAWAQVTGEIVDWGPSAGRREEAGGTRQPGEIGLSPAKPRTDIRYLARTDRIEARLCRSFGMTVRVSAGSERMPSSVEVRVSHPRFTRPDGATSTEDRFRSAVVDGRTRVGFTFDHAWEMEPGAWSMSVAVRGAEIARKSFTVVAPAPGSPSSDCQTDPAS